MSAVWVFTSFSPSFKKSKKKVTPAVCHQDVTNSEFVVRSTSGLDGEQSLAVGRQATVGQKTIEGTRRKEGSERRESLDSKKSQALPAMLSAI